MFLKFIKFSIILLLLSSNLFANEVPNANDSRLKSIENYLNKIKFIKANFIQDDITNSQLSEGVFYLSKPGKLRIDYTNPFEANLYTNNNITTYYDKELDEISKIRTKSTPLHFLLNKEISFSNKDVYLEKINEDKNFIFVYAKETEKKEQGTLILKFSKNPVALVSIKIINELNQEVEMSLFNIDNSEINDSIFKFKSPRLKKI